MSAARTTAIALHDLTSDDCNRAHILKVSFRWEGRQVVADDQPDCGLDYVTGEQITIYVSSANPANIGPTEEWILDPSTHNPFDFIGPNGMPSFLTMLGVVATGIACTLTIVRVLRSRAHSPSEANVFAPTGRTGQSERTAADLGGDAPPLRHWLASDGNWYPQSDPPSAGKALLWTLLSSFWLWLLLPLAVHYTRKARREADESQGRYVWSRSLLHRPVLLWAIVFACSMALILAMAAVGMYGD